MNNPTFNGLDIAVTISGIVVGSVVVVVTDEDSVKVVDVVVSDVCVQATIDIENTTRKIIKNIFFIFTLPLYKAYYQYTAIKKKKQEFSCF